MVAATIECPSGASPEFLSELRNMLEHYFGEVSVYFSNDSLTIDGDSPRLQSEASAIVEHFGRFYKPSQERVLLEPSLEVVPSCCAYHETRGELLPGVYFQDGGWHTEVSELREKIKTRFHAGIVHSHFEVPSLIKTDALNRAGYLQKFPGAVSHVSRLKTDYWSSVNASQNDISQYNDDLILTGSSLNPVTCLQVFSNAQAFFSQAAAQTVSIEGRVFRHEGHRHSATRLAEFSMYELIHIGHGPSCIDFFENTLRRFHSFFTELGLPVVVTTASDMFFGEAALLRRRLQLASGLKAELRVKLQDGSMLSIASINRHGEYFFQKFGLDEHFDASESACAGIGLDRVIFALRQYGTVGNSLCCDDREV